VSVPFFSTTNRICNNNENLSFGSHHPKIDARLMAVHLSSVSLLGGPHTSSNIYFEKVIKRDPGPGYPGIHWGLSCTGEGDGGGRRGVSERGVSEHE
jgi:hypothetical protein